jgi:hypothetical protein
MVDRFISLHSFCELILVGSLFLSWQVLGSEYSLVDPLPKMKFVIVAAVVTAVGADPIPCESVTLFQPFSHFLPLVLSKNIQFPPSTLQHLAQGLPNSFDHSIVVESAKKVWD